MQNVECRSQNIPKGIFILHSEFVILHSKERGGMFSVALSVGPRMHSEHLPRVSRCPPPYVGGYGLRGIAPSGVRTFLPPENLRGSDPPPFQNQE